VRHENTTLAIGQGHAIAQRKGASLKARPWCLMLSGYAFGITIEPPAMPCGLALS